MLAHRHLRFGRLFAATAIVALLGGSCGSTSLTASPAAQSPATSPATSTATSTAATPSARACAATPSDSPDGPWWRDRVFYEVFVRSFADSDGDGIGDLRGLIDRLDYLNDGDPGTHDDLGVTGIWLMPVAESPSYHGYDVTDYLTVEKDYGTNADFETLVAAAHDRGIAVIVDLVMNHTSVEHPWFADARTRGSPHEAWYVWSDTAAFAGPGGRPVWHRAGDRYYYGYFWEGMPDLNVANPDVTGELDRIARFWVEDLGADGFRLDAARHLIEDGDELENTPATRTWLTAWRQRLRDADPDGLVVGEVWDATSNAARYVREGSLDVAFEFGLASAFLTALRAGDAETIAAIQAEVDAAYPAGGYAAFLTNHDQDRAFDQMGRDAATAKAGATLLLTSAGLPFIYYGEELGLGGRKPDERIRTPLPWDASTPGAGFTTGRPWEALAPNADVANVAAQTDDPASLLAHYRALIALRNEHAALRTGDLVPIKSDTRGVYAYLRDGAGETMLVLVNLDDQPKEGFELALETGPLCGTSTPETLLGTATVAAPSLTSSGGFDGWAPVAELAPRESLVVRLSP